LPLKPVEKICFCIVENPFKSFLVRYLDIRMPYHEMPRHQTPEYTLFFLHSLTCNMQSVEGNEKNAIVIQLPDCFH
jgi:hypothetical protein